MKKMPASIFNDVIGPVMRGPSSSHVAGASRIAELVRQSMGGDIVRVSVDFDVNGSLAKSHDGHGTDMGFVGGILGMEMTDPALLNAESIARTTGIEVTFNVCDYGAKHPNNYRVKVHSSNGKSHTWEAISVGGGMIEMQHFDGFDVAISGGYHELLIVLRKSPQSPVREVQQIEAFFPDRASSSTSHRPKGTLLSVQLETAPPISTLHEFHALPFVQDLVYLKPILPTNSRTSCHLPFNDVESLLATAESSGLEMWKLAAQYESARGKESEHEVFERMRALLRIMRSGVQQGLSGTNFADRILAPQAHLINDATTNHRLFPCDILNTAIQYVTAIMEVKSSMGVIVAAPTAGSCGCLPGTILAISDILHLDEDEMVKGLLAAGLVGVFIAESATFAAEVAGCQVECGAGSGMAAAALVQMHGGTVRQCVDAASMALQNITGLACDPVANRVEIPCLGKNVMGASNAIASANMTLAGFNAVIPLDQTIAALYDVGTKLPLELRCTFGGLGKTEASLRIREELEVFKTE